MSSHAPSQIICIWLNRYAVNKICVHYQRRCITLINQHHGKPYLMNVDNDFYVDSENCQLQDR